MQTLEIGIFGHLKTWKKGWLAVDETLGSTLITDTTNMISLKLEKKEGNIKHKGAEWNAFREVDTSIVNVYLLRTLNQLHIHKLP